jgi:hypothetical protein
MDFTQGIKIDNIYFDIPLVSLKRNADVLDKYANRTEDGDLKREIIGVYYNFTLTVGVVENPAVYQSLWDKLTEPTEFHTVELPDINGVYRFTAYISSVSDEYMKIKSNSASFQGLTAKFTAKSPARR